MFPGNPETSASASAKFFLSETTCLCTINRTLC